MENYLKLFFLIWLWMEEQLKSFDDSRLSVGNNRDKGIHLNLKMIKLTKL